MRKIALLAVGFLLLVVPWAARPGNLAQAQEPPPPGWKALGPTGGNVAAIAVNPSNGNEVFAIAGGSTTQFLKSTNGGRDWAKVSDIPSQTYDLAVNSSNSNIIYVLSDNYVYRSTDKGATWGQSSLGSGNYGYNGQIATNKADANTIYAAGYRWEGSLGFLIALKSTDGGVTWTSQKLSSGYSSVSVGGLAAFPNSASIVYAAGSMYDGSSYAYKVYKTENGGASWQDVSGPINGTPYDILFDPGSSQKVYVSVSGKVFRTTNGGAAWTQSNGYTYANSLSLDPLNANIIYGAYNGEVYKSTDGAVNWVSLTSGLKGTGKDVFVLPAGAGILYSSTTGIFKSTDGGTNWQNVSSGFTANNVQAIGFAPSSPGRVYANCVGNDLFKSESFGDSWGRCASYGWCEGIQRVIVHPTLPDRLFIVAGG